MVDENVAERPAWSPPPTETSVVVVVVVVVVEEEEEEGCCFVMANDEVVGTWLRLLLI